MLNWERVLSFMSLTTFSRHLRMLSCRLSTSANCWLTATSFSSTPARMPAWRKVGCPTNRISPTSTALIKLLPSRSNVPDISSPAAMSWPAFTDGLSYVRLESLTYIAQTVEHHQLNRQEQPENLNKPK